MFNLFGSDSREKIIQYLAKNPNKSSKEIDESINKYSKQLDYKNIFRILTELLEQRVISKKNSKYYLTSEFIEHVKNTSDNMLDNYTDEMFVRNKTDLYNVMLYLDPDGEVISKVSNYLNSWLMEKLDVWYSKYYDPKNSEFSKIAEKIEEKFQTNKDINILEVGCGTERITDKLNEIYSNITSIDINDRYINYCKKKYSKKSIKFHTSDISNFKSKNKFDVIVLSWIGFHHQKNINDILDNIKKLCTNESLVLIIDAYHETEYVDILNMLRPIDMDEVKLIKEKLNKKIISKFGNLKHEVVLNHYKFDSVQSLIDNFKIELTLEESRIWTKEDKEKIKEYLLGKNNSLKIGEGFWLSVIDIY